MLGRMRRLIYSDNDLLIVNKPSGLSLLADRSGAPNLWDQLKQEYGKLYLVHRLDKDTSGVLAVARTQSLQTQLTGYFRDRQVQKFYCARVLGTLALAGSGEIDLPLTKGRKSRYRIAAQRADIVREQDKWQLQPGAHIHPQSVVAQTRVRLLGLNQTPQKGTDLVLRPTTGRTHQLRVHLSWIGHPILGERLYGKPKDLAQQADRLYLHAHRLQFPGFPAFLAPIPWASLAPTLSVNLADT